MFLNFPPSVSSVTSRFGLDKFHFASVALLKRSHRLGIALAKRKRADASVPNKKVRELLLLASSNGMSQKDFEVAAGKLRFNSSTREKQGFNGSLWHDYTTTDAHMSCLTFAENAMEFHVRGWIDDHQLRDFMLESLFIELLAKLGRPATEDELETRLALAWLKGTIERLAPNMPNRVRGATMRNITKLPQGEQAAAAKEVAHQLMMLDQLGHNLEKREIAKSLKAKFGTNLSH